MIVIGKRLNGMGRADFTISRQGDSGLILQVPGAMERESVRIRSALERLAKFELREICPRNAETDANALMNPLEFPLKIAEMRTIPPKP